MLILSCKYTYYLLKDKKVFLLFLIIFIIFAENKFAKDIQSMFNKETEYALRGLVYIQIQNLRGRKPGVAEIAKEIDAPPFFTAKILQRIVRQGFVKSLKGKGGGFYFDLDKPDLPIKDLIVATEGGTLLSGCGFGLRHCDINNPCPLHEKYSFIRDAINSLVSSETIQTLASKYTKPANLPEK
jgi:Rrf2 family protein